MVDINGKSAFRWCTDEFGGLVAAHTKSEAVAKLVRRYGKMDFEVWPWEDDDYYDNTDEDIFDVYGW